MSLSDRDDISRRQLLRHVGLVGTVAAAATVAGALDTARADASVPTYQSN